MVSTRGVEMADSGMSMLGKSPLIFRSSGPMCQMYYAEYQEKDGTFGEVAKNAWIGADTEWKRYGSEEIPTSFRNEKTQGTRRPFGWAKRRSRKRPPRNSSRSLKRCSRDCATRSLPRSGRP